MAERTFWQWLEKWMSRRRRREDDHERSSTMPRSAPRADGPAYRCVADDLWTGDGKFALDPRLRVALAQLAAGHPAQVFERTGIDVASQSPALRVFVELDRPLTRSVQAELGPHLEIANAYVEDAAIVPQRRVFPARLKVAIGDLGIDARRTRDRLVDLVQKEHVRRLELAPPGRPCLNACRNETLDDFDLAPDRHVTIDGKRLHADGTHVVIGIVDDGCALAHWNFMAGPGRSRLRYVWDQGRTRPHAAWTKVTDFQDGYELINPLDGTGPLDAALALHTGANGVVDEDAVYAALDFPAPDVPSHGTHVMDIAAGNGKALFGRENVAPNAELIFVQLPGDLVAAGGPALFECIAHGADYVFRRAKVIEAALGKRVPAVVNVSFGNYVGPHDGTSATEAAFEGMLTASDRALVVAAGNGFAAGCHAQGAVAHRHPVRLQWWVPPGDESVNSLEIWYRDGANLSVQVLPPGVTSATAIGAGDPRYNIVDPTNNVIGYIDHVGPLTSNGDAQIVVTLNGTLATPGSAPPAVPGIWTIRLEKPNAGAPHHYDAWIERDETRRGDVVRRRQSRFADTQASPLSTVTGIATGASTIAVGAYSTASGEVAEYSGCGPTRASTLAPQPRPKPELCAPCASDARMHGTLSADMRFALSVRMGGTSAAAPHVTGLAALALQLNRDAGRNPLPVAALRAHLVDGALAGGRALRPNRHQLADRHQKVKQDDPAVLKALVGAGRADANETFKKI